MDESADCGADANGDIAFTIDRGGHIESYAEFEIGLFAVEFIGGGIGLTLLAGGYRAADIGFIVADMNGRGFVVSHDDFRIGDNADTRHFLQGAQNDRKIVGAQDGGADVRDGADIGGEDILLIQLALIDGVGNGPCGGDDGISDIVSGPRRTFLVGGGDFLVLLPILVIAFIDLVDACPVIFLLEDIVAAVDFFALILIGDFHAADAELIPFQDLPIDSEVFDGLIGQLDEFGFDIDLFARLIDFFDDALDFEEAGGGGADDQGVAGGEGHDGALAGQHGGDDGDDIGNGRIAEEDGFRHQGVWLADRFGGDGVDFGSSGGFNQRQVVHRQDGVQCGEPLHILDIDGHGAMQIGGRSDDIGA
ncbi:MAG: hypothetical protein BWY82_02150 [Verrucomicrobia bacterium ADurb.Bin474]|nr:MAG: hypothetical protein BWY82_02150 [Verrucomicrobia bacterium ADurb.Bin474]